MLRYLSFQFLRDGPMSGSEIVDRIEDYTDWRPSPGSIYPLLSHMQEAGLIRPHVDEDPTLKRFELTEKGMKNAEELMERDGQMRSRNRTLRKMYWRLHTGMDEQLYESLRDLLETLEDIYKENKGDAKVTEKLKFALDSTVQTIKEIDA